jgi:hypothetical protein
MLLLGEYLGANEFDEILLAAALLLQVSKVCFHLLQDI